MWDRSPDGCRALSGDWWSHRTPIALGVDLASQLSLFSATNVAGPYMPVPGRLGSVDELLRETAGILHSSRFLSE
jgi:hypothetical protein